MSKEEYRQYTAKLMYMIDDQDALQRIYGYANRQFVSLPMAQGDKEAAQCKE